MAREENFHSIAQIDPIVLISLAIACYKMGIDAASIAIVQLIKREGVAMIEKLENLKTLAKEFTDWVRAEVQTQPLPNVLPENVADLSKEEIAAQICSYLGSKPEYLNQYFRSYKIIGENEDIAEVILKDARTLKELGISRKTLADKLQAIITLGYYHSTLEMYSIGEHHGAQHSARITKAKEKLKPLITEALKELNIEPTNLNEFPIKVEYLGTMGHHNDAFHPSFSMQSYYLKGDKVGGSAEVLIKNSTLEKGSVTEEQMKNFLTERLNAKHKAEWEDAPEFIYCSDMAPYLIRVACCFEGPTVRYRVDPKKLCKVLGLIK